MILLLTVYMIFQDSQNLNFGKRWRSVVEINKAVTSNEGIYVFTLLLYLVYRT